MGRARNEVADNHAPSKQLEDAAEDQRPAKRTRVSRACDQCRASREKCDGSQPTCKSCLTQSRECTYNEAPKKRGIQPNYIRTLELLLAWMIEQSSDLQQHLCNSLPLDESHVHRVLSGKDPDEAEKLHQTWRSSIVGRQIDQVLSGNKVEPPSGIEERPLQHVAQVEGGRALAHEIELLKLPPNAWTLLDFYFAYVHSWIPMTEKANMMKLIYAYPAEGIPMNQAALAEHAELWSIMAVASHFVGSHTDEGQTESLRVRNLAENLVPTGKTYEVPHLKALVLLTLVDMSEGRTLDAWLRIGTAVRILSLFQLLEENGTTRWCRHVHLAAFLVESALALRMNARGHLTPEYIENVGFINEDGRDEWDPWQDPLASSVNNSRAPARSFSTLNKLVKMHMQLFSGEMEQSCATDAVSNRNIVFNLLENALRGEGRLQPAVLLERSQGVSNRTQPDLFGDIHAEVAGTAWSVSSQPRIQPQPPDKQGYTQVSVLNDFAEVPPSTIAPTALDSTGSIGGSDIFQELAMLEHTDSSNQFMQNLGFGPDLDLQEFFGDAYQASDPMLSLMQPAPHFGGQQNP